MSFVTVLYGKQVEQVAKESSLGCQEQGKGRCCIKFSMSNQEKERPTLNLALQHYGTAHVGLDAWASIFKYIRSHWLIEYLGFTQSSVPITLRIQDGLWYHNYHAAGLLGIGNDDIKEYPNLYVGKYMQSAAKKVLGIVGNPQVAVGWR